jgi:hypothetical protein
MSHNGNSVINYISFTLRMIICISLMDKDVEHIFMYFVLVPSKSYLFSSFACLLIILFVLLLFIFWVIFQFLSPCWINIWQRFSLICWLFLYNLMQFHLSILAYISWDNWSPFRKSLHLSISQMFPSNTFKGSDLTLMSLIHFELIFWVGWERRIKFQFPMCRHPVFPASLVEANNVLVPLSKISAYF